MRILRPSSEAEMIAEFLRQEYAHPERYGSALGAAMTGVGVSSSLIADPDLSDAVANEARRRVLAAYRGYGTGGYSYLTGFPDHGVEWTWMALTSGELLESRIIHYLSRHELKASTRDLRGVSDRIRRGEIVGEFADRVLTLAGLLRNGLNPPPVILVSDDGGQTRVIVEGHTRALAWAVAPDTIAPETEVLLGTSPTIANWDEY